MTKRNDLRRQLQASIREIVFGMEDSLVSTLGAVTGIAAGTGSTFVVILSGVVLIFVEALSMTAGSYLSSKNARAVMQMQKKGGHTHAEEPTPIQAAFVMGVFYLAGGAFPLLPYFFFDVLSAIIPSIVLTGVVLFVFGSATARVTKRVWWKSGLEMMGVSLTAALLGFLIGRVVSAAFGVAVV